jgi:hypothetical protein
MNGRRLLDAAFVKTAMVNPDVEAKLFKPCVLKLRPFAAKLLDGVGVGGNAVNRLLLPLPLALLGNGVRVARLAETLRAELAMRQHNMGVDISGAPEMHGNIGGDAVFLDLLPHIGRQHFVALLMGQRMRQRKL